MIPYRRIVSLALLFAVCWLPVHAQVRTTGEIRGTVTDPSGALVAAVTITAKDLATGVIQTATSNETGAFVILNLQSGTYEVTAKADGFQTTVIQKVVVETARTLDLNIQLKVGQVAVTVEVQGAAPLLQTTTNTIATTIRNDYVQDLPMAGRDTLQFAALMAGAQSPGQGTRNSTFNGLPNASLNITLDGINNNSQRFRTGGTSFFAFAPLRLDAVEEITVATTGAGADAAAGAAMTMRFTTRRGTNQFHGRVFEQFANDALNANTFFNNATGQRRAKVRQHDFGGRFGGPLRLPYVKNKLFFFVNFEVAPRPATENRSTSVLTPAAQQGIFSYRIADGSVRTANVLQLAGDAGAGLTNRIDPTVQGILGVINGATAKGSTIPNSANPNFLTLNWSQKADVYNYYPTARLDFQITPKIAWHGTWNLRWQHNLGRPMYPELQKADAYKTTTYVASNAVDWTISPNILNTFNFGVQSNVELFSEDNDIRQWSAYGNRRIHLPQIGTITPGDVVPNQTPFIRNNPVYVLYDNLNWVKGRHTFTFGGSYLHTSFYETSWNNAGVLNYNLGVASGDPLSAALPAARFPGISTTDLNSAWALYAGLTGRLSSISGSRNVDEISHSYTDFASITQRHAFTTGGLYFQDSFRWSPSLTLNYGFRWEFSGAMHNTNKIDTPPDLANFFGPSTGLFQPGVLNGVANPQLTVRPYTYSGDKINPAPNLGFAWSPKFDSGLLGRLVGSKTVFRGSYAINYFDEGLNSFSNRVSNNPGTTQTINIQPGVSFNAGALNLTSAIPAPVVNPQSFTFPMPMSLFTFGTAGMQTSKPEMHTPYVQNWTLSVQREIGRGMVVEARYVGNKTTHAWHAYSLNETNIFENGFLQEFKNAQNNLRINGNTSFQNRGLPGQVALPILDAAFGARGSQAALAAGSGYTSGTFINNLTLGNAGTMANTLATNNIYYCRMVGSGFRPCADLGYNAAGPYPINVFRANPFVSGALTLLDDNSYSTYHGLQLEFRKAYSHGLTLNANYTWSKALSDLFNLDNQDATVNYRTLRNRGLNKGPSAFDLRHVALGYWTYALPFGKGRLFLNSGGWFDRIVGGWQISGLHRYNSGSVYQLSGSRNTFNNIADSGVILSGMTIGELQDKMRTFRPGPTRNAAADASLTGADGRANSTVLSVPSTPGVFGQFVYLYNTPLVINDFGLSKVIPITERMKFTFQIEAINVFNHPVLAVGTTNIDSTAFGQTTNTRVGPRNLQIRAHFDW